VGWCRAPRVFEVLTAAFDLRPSLDEVHIGQTSFPKCLVFIGNLVDESRCPMSATRVAGYQELVQADLLIPENLSTSF